jgi:hypothetical protein
MMKVDASESAFPPVDDTLALNEGRRMDVDLDSEPSPYLGSPGIMEDLDLYDPRLHDFRPSLIGRCFEEGEEEVVVPYNWDEECQYQDSLLPCEGGSAVPDAGHRREPSTLSLDSPLRLVSRQEDQYVECPETAVYEPARPLYSTVRSVSSSMDWANATMQLHQSDDQIDHLMQSLQRLTINDEDEKAIITVLIVPTVPSPSEIPTEFSQDANANPVLDQRPHRFRIFSDLESAFDESRFTYLSGLLNRKPLDLPFFRGCVSQPDPCVQDSEPPPKRLRGEWRWGKRGKARQP